MTSAKVFNIGFHKTGTTSLTAFVRRYGYRVLHSVAYSMESLGLGAQDDDEEEGGSPADVSAMIAHERLDALVRQYDYFSDNPWPLLYERLDRLYPGSRFILTRRDADDWVRSLVRHCGDQSTRMRKLIYGYGNPRNHARVYERIYVAHNENVLSYFDGRDDFLLLDLEEDNAVIAERVCDFLGLDAGGSVFPALNRRDVSM